MSDGADSDPGPDPRDGVGPALRWLLETDDERVVFVREIVKSVAVVAVLALVLVAISGVWPPMVAVESGSMEPNMHRGDLVFVVEEHRYAAGSSVAGTGVVTHEVARDAGYRKFGGYGDVIVFQPPGGGGPPTIHRARMWVTAGENWVADANPRFVPAGGCDAISSCPATHDGFVTKGDDNPYYDQASGIAPVVKPEWIKGRAAVRVPYLGYVRLFLSGMAA